MLSTLDPASERQVVQRMFTVRWTRGCIYSQLHGQLSDDARARAEVLGWGGVLRDIMPQVTAGLGTYVSVIDATALSAVPRGLWLSIARMVANLPARPHSRALIASDGWAGDNHAETAQLVTAGSVRVFKPAEIEAAMAWLSRAGLIEAEQLRRFLS